MKLVFRIFTKKQLRQDGPTDKTALPASIVKSNAGIFCLIRFITTRVGWSKLSLNLNQMSAFLQQYKTMSLILRTVKRDAL